MAENVLTTQVGGRYVIVCRHCTKRVELGFDERVPGGFCSKGCALAKLACRTEHPGRKEAAECLGLVNRTFMIADCVGIAGEAARIRFYDNEGKTVANTLIALDNLPDGVEAGTRLRLAWTLIGRVEQ
jgi:hypothetical protein